MFREAAPGTKDSQFLGRGVSHIDTENQGRGKHDIKRRNGLLESAVLRCVAELSSFEIEVISVQIQEVPHDPFQLCSGVFSADHPFPSPQGPKGAVPLVFPPERPHATFIIIP